MFFIRLLKVLLSRFGRITVTGAEYLDGPRGKIVVCNHVGWADPLWMGYSALPHTLYQMAKKELFDNPLVGWFVRQGDGFPIDRGRPSAATIKQVVSYIQRGERVLIFPTGTRSGSQAEAKRGAATIALRANGEVVPAFYNGPKQIRFIHLFRRPVIHVRFGPPILAPLDATSDKVAALKLTEEIHEAIVRLSLNSGKSGN